MSVDLIARVRKDAARAAELKKCQDDLYFLCSEVLDYKWNPSKQQGMTEAFHGPLCERMDRLRDHPRILTLAPRKHLKTTVFTIGLAVQEILRDANVTILIPHAVEEEAVKIVAEITDHFKANKRLRALEPSMMPATNGKWWYGSGRMRLRTTKYSRQPTVMGCGAGSEIGGAHCDIILPDDIIGRRTIENSEMPKIASWWQNTAVHVLNNDGRVRAVGTRWHPDDIWQDFIDSGLWDVLVRAASEVDGKADYTLKNPVHFGTEKGGFEKAQHRLEMNQKESKGDFAAQMMNDPSPASEKPWDASKCEHYVSLKEYGKVRRGTRFVLGDPAPAKVGSLDLTGAKLRADGTKDEWCWQVVEVRANGKRQEIVWLDGSASRDWTRDEGFDEGCRLAKKWGTPFIAVESLGQAIALYDDDMRRATRKAGVGYSQVKLKATYKGKNTQFAALCSRAERDEFLILDTIDEDFRAGTLFQCREWRPLESGRNALKYDDRANALSFACDPALQEYAPQAEPHNDPAEEEMEREYAMMGHKTRYMGM